jgi:hypothetical protein
MCAQINPSLPTLGGARGDGETNLRADVVAILNEINGNLDSSNIKDGTLRTADLDSAGTVTALPASPYDGQEINYLADPTNGVVWRFKYRAASAATSKWECIGGSPLSVTIDTAETVATTTFSGLTTDGPTITVPLPGDYDVDLEANTFAPAAVAGAVGQMGFGVAAAAPLPADTAMASIPTVNAPFDIKRSRRKTALAASTVLRCLYAASAGSATFRYRRMCVTPVRVG